MVHLNIIRTLDIYTAYNSFRSVAGSASGTYPHPRCGYSPVVCVSCTAIPENLSAVGAAAALLCHGIEC